VVLALKIAIAPLRWKIQSNGWRRMLRLTIRLNIGERTISDLSEPLLGRTLDQEFEQSREGLRLLRAFGEAEKFHLAPQDTGLVAGMACPG